MAVTINGDTGIASVNGSAGSPSVRGTDSNSGIFYAADEIMFSVGGDEIAKISEATNGDSLHLGDSKRFTLGGTADSPDCYFYADTSNTNLQNITGDMFIRSNADGDKAIVVRNGAGVDLYFDNTKQIETTSTGCDIFNVYGNVVGGSIRDLYIRNDGRLGYDSSVRASKVNIADLTDVSWLDDLKPKTFNKKKQDNTGAFTSENYTQLEYGLIAEDVETVNKELCSYSTEDVLEAVHYKKLITPILKALQDARTEITTLKTKVAALEAA